MLIYFDQYEFYFISMTYDIEEDNTIEEDNIMFHLVFLCPTL